MSSVEFLLLLALAAVVTPFPVLLIPRLRESPVFNALLWAATFVTAFLSAWLATGLTTMVELPALRAWMIVQVPVLAALIGAVVGGLAVNLPLWIMDRFAQSEYDEDAAPFESTSSSNGEREH